MPKQTQLFNNGIVSKLISYMNPFAKRSVRIWGTNICSLKSKAADLEQRIEKHRPDVILLNETWLQGTNETFNHPDYLEIASVTAQTNQGTAILLRKGQFQSCYQIKHPDKNLTEIVWTDLNEEILDILRVSLKLFHRLHLYSMYLPPQSDSSSKEQRSETFKRLLTSIKASGAQSKKASSTEIIGFCDFNENLRGNSEENVKTTKSHQQEILSEFESRDVRLIFNESDSAFTHKQNVKNNQVSSSYIDYFFASTHTNYSQFLIEPPIGKSDHSLLTMRSNHSKRIIDILNTLILIAFASFFVLSFQSESFLDSIISFLSQYLSGVPIKQRNSYFAPPPR